MFEQVNAAQTVPSWGRRLWNHPVTRILAYFGLCGLLLLGFGGAVWGGLSLARVHLWPDDESTIAPGYAIAALAVVLAFVVMVRRVDGRSLASAGLRLRGMLTETGAGLVIGGGLFCAVIGVMECFGSYRIGGVNGHFQPLVPLGLFLALGIFQEVPLRGYLLQTIERRWGTSWAVGVTSALFGLLHLGAAVDGLTTAQWLLGPILITFETGLLFAGGYLLTRRLWLPVGLHWGWNFFESSVFGLPNTGSWGDAPNTLFLDRTSGPFLLTGGAFGPEASLPCLVVGTTAGVILLWLAWRRGQWQSQSYQVK